MEEWQSATFGILFGLASLIVGGELLVRGASRLASALSVSPLVIGLTVVAFGTSSPELAVALQSAFDGSADIALGNAVGSNIFNVLLILGVSALIVPLVVSSRLIRWDVPLMVLASLLLYGLGFDGRIGRVDGAILFSGLIAYVGWSFVQSRRESRQVKAEFAAEVPVPARSVMAMMLQIGLIIGGLLLLGLGANWLIDGSVSVATELGVSELVIGLTVVAMGTSLPEVVTSVMAAWRGEREIAVGNVVGSNLFNILCVLGLVGLVAPDGVGVPPPALRFDLPVMIAVAVSCLPIFFTGNVIARWEGGLFLGYYVAYMTYLVLAATQAAITRTFVIGMTGFVIPLTVITLAVTATRTARGD